MNEVTSGALFETVQRRILEAKDRVALLDASEEVKAAAIASLTSLERASHTDLSIASREVEAFHADLDADVIPIYR